MRALSRYAWILAGGLTLVACGPSKNLSQESKNICRRAQDRLACARLAMLMEARVADAEDDAAAAMALGAAGIALGAGR